MNDFEGQIIPGYGIIENRQILDQFDMIPLIVKLITEEGDCIMLNLVSDEETDSLLKWIAYVDNETYGTVISRSQILKSPQIWYAKLKMIANNHRVLLFSEIESEDIPEDELPLK